MEAFEDRMRRGGNAAIEAAGQFFMRADPVHHALHAIVRRLDALGVPYAIVGGMALVAHGYDRTTADVDILVGPEGHRKALAELTGSGYRPAFEGSRHLRDVENGVRIEFRITGGFPGDGKPKPVAFPDPADCRVEIDRAFYVSLPRLIELKLASGMTNPGRLKDLADVQELIRARGLAQEFAGGLNEYVRGKYLELWSAVQADPA